MVSSVQLAILMGASDMINPAEVAVACRIQKIGPEKEAIRPPSEANEKGAGNI
jgi:hypothetical protein